MNIGTDKPNRTLLEIYKHHCIDVVEPSDNFDVKRYVTLAKDNIFNILFRGKKPLIVGGTGLYIKSLINPIFDGPGRNQNIRDRLLKIENKKGNVFLYKLLKKYDPEYSKKINVNDSRRIIRGLEVFYLTGKPITHFHNYEKNDDVKNYKNHNSNSTEKIVRNNDYFVIYVFRNRENLYKMINERVDKIIKNGLIDETQSLINKYGNIDSFNSMQGIGYKQILAFLHGKMTKEEAVENIKIKTRQFAKRQISYFKNQISIDYEINLDNYKSTDDVIDVILNLMRREGY